MTAPNRNLKALLALGLGALTGARLPFGAGAGTALAATPNLGQLQSQLGDQQSQQQSLSANIAHLDALVSSLDSQIALVQGREATVRAALDHDRLVLAAATGALRRERSELRRLRARLARAQMILSNQLVSSYEGVKPDLVTVVLNSNGFTQLLDQISFLVRAEQQQQTMITVTRVAKARADAAAVHLADLQRDDRAITNRTALEARALDGMNALLESRQTALADATAAQQDALAASRRRGAQLQHAISRIEAQQAAAARAAALAVGSYSGPALTATAGWAIPYAIVLCESGGQNLPPNSAGASGYYQIIPGTWRLFGGTGPAAYLTSKAEQDAVAARIWNGGAGASNWVCASIVGIT
jgi:hypothetical protein